MLQSNPLGRTIARLFVMDGTIALLPVGQRFSLPGHFDSPVVLKAARPFARGFQRYVRLPEDPRQTAFVAWANVRLIGWIAVELARIA